MKGRTQLIVGIGCLALAVLLFSFGATRLDGMFGTANVHVYPAGFFALVGAVQVGRFVLGGLQ